MSEFLESLEGWTTPYLGRISLQSENGDAVTAEDPLKNQTLIVMDSTVTPIKALALQVVKVEGVQDRETAYVKRVVATLEDGKEIDIAEPMAIPADIVEMGIDTSICAACALPLDAADLRLIDGHAYHDSCIVEGE